MFSITVIVTWLFSKVSTYPELGQIRIWPNDCIIFSKGHKDEFEEWKSILASASENLRNNVQEKLDEVREWRRLEEDKVKQLIGKVSMDFFMKKYKKTYSSLVLLILIQTLINRNVIRVFIIKIEEPFELYYAFS